MVLLSTPNLDTPPTNIAEAIAQLKAQRKAVILAHYYQDGSIQDIA